MANKRGYEKISTEDSEGEEKVNCLSVLFFQWMNNVLQTGSERALEKSDFLPLSKENSSSSATDQLQTKWNEEIARCESKGKNPKLWKSIVKMVSTTDFLIITFTSVLDSCCRILQPLFLGYLISALRTADETRKNPLLYVCAAAMAFNAFVKSMGMQQFSFRNEMLGIKLSSAIKGIVYRKILLLSKQALMRYTTGRVIDIVSNDVQRLEDTKWPFFLFKASIELIVVTALLCYVIGWQALMGVIFLVLLVPYFGLLSSAAGSLRLRTAAVSDRRISMMNEILSGIRAIKAHAWEDEHRTKIDITRRHEISILRKKSAVLSAVGALEYTSGAMATLVSVVTLLLTGQQLTPVNVFMLLSLNNVLRLSISVFIAFGLVETAEAYNSINRIEDFLLLDNLPTKECRETTEKTNTHGNKLTISEREGEDVFEFSGEDKTFSSHPTTILSVTNLMCKHSNRENLVLEDVELHASIASLTAITGSVGSGKSTLLSAIAGEVSDTSGTISYLGSFVYMPQIAWVFSGTIRENILFGQTYDEPKYTRIIEACALTEDIQQFPDCDQTVVGERGAVLSGGQRARVSLARAVYADVDIYLLDDPLSAVDVKVGKHIFENCIKGLLNQKTRVLSSHHEQLLKEADHVIVLYQGRVLGKGTFTELQSKGILSTTVDPLLKKPPTESELDENVEVQSEDEISASKGALNSQAKSLVLPQEDRAIGVVSSTLYWAYFRSGLHLLAILAGVCFCFVTQGWLSLHKSEMNK